MPSADSGTHGHLKVSVRLNSTEQPSSRIVPTAAVAPDGAEVLSRLPVSFLAASAAQQGRFVQYADRVSHPSAHRLALNRRVCPSRRPASDQQGSEAEGQEAQPQPQRQ